MEGLNTPIPHRLFYIRIIATLGLVISFLMSMNLWGGERYFPTIPLFEHFFLKPPFDYILVVLSCVFLLCSLVFRNTRLFLFLSVLVNIFLVMFDLNRLQPWFYIYNVLIIIFLFYNGRVDDANRFTSIFIFLQVVIAAVYVHNGFNQLRNPLFLVGDFQELIQPLKSVLSDRQFSLVLKSGNIVPFITIFIGIGILIRPVKYLAISLGLIMHLVLFILLFPSAQQNNYALWFMNFVFAGMILFLFSGKTKQRYFSYSFLFQKPLFYILLVSFWVMPAFHRVNRWPQALSFNFKSGAVINEHITLSKSSYDNLPLYIRGFCLKKDEGYILQLQYWCRHELRSEFLNNDFFAQGALNQAIQMVTAAPALPEKELSVR